MAKNLVIVESPAKAKTIEGFLGSDYIVKSCFGHIRDLPKSDISIDIKNNYAPQYQISPDKKDIIKELTKLSKEADTVWLASDEDREGEAISWHLFEALNLNEAKTKRIVFHEITKQAIIKAIDSPSKIDYNLVNAQQARRILDRIVGYELSPILWKKVKPSLSEGRVQSVTVRLLVDREREINGFLSVSAYRVVALLSFKHKEKAYVLKATLPQKIEKETDAKTFLENCKDALFSIGSVEKKPASLNPGSFITLKNNSIVYSAIYKHLETNMSTVLGQYALVTDYRYRGGDNHITNESTFNMTDLHADLDFTTMFEYRSSIGGIYGNYEGTIMSFRNFLDYHSTLSTYHSIVHNMNETINCVNKSIAMNHHMYVSTKYTNVLPQKIIDTRAYTSNQSVPVSFVTSATAYVPGMSAIGALDVPASNTPTITTLNAQSDLIELTDLTDATNQITNIMAASTPSSVCSTICCNYITKMLTKWYSELPVNSVIGTLTYRLGLVNIAANQYNIVSTILQYNTTGALNFLMQINDEQGFNNMDIAMNENYSIANDTTGQLKLVAAKILMANVGDSGISQTLIQNPSIFENTLGKLDRLNIKLYYDDSALTPAWLYLPFQYDVNEWNATFQIDEEVGFINQVDNWPLVPSIPIPKNPNELSYIYLSKKEKK